MGAGGPTGAVGFGLGFRQLESVKNAYFLMGGVVIFSGLLSCLITVKGHRGLLFGHDSKDPNMLQVPAMDEEGATAVNNNDPSTHQGGDENAVVEKADEQADGENTGADPAVVVEA